MQNIHEAKISTQYNYAEVLPPWQWLLVSTLRRMQVLIQVSSLYNELTFT